MLNSSRIITHLKTGGVGVLATDTLYGLVGSALSHEAVDRIYKLKNRSAEKPLIILIGQLSDLELFGVHPSANAKQHLTKYWPGPVSIILPCRHQDLHYLHRGTNTLAFRIPAKPSLRRLLKKSGPLVAPSANPEELPPATNLAEAKKYFGDNADFYLRGRVKNRASKLIAIEANGDLRVLRR